MKKIHIQYRSGLLIGLLSLSTLFSCVNTRREMVPSQARGVGNWNTFNIDRERDNSLKQPGTFVVDLLDQMLGDINADQNADQKRPFAQRGSAWQKVGTNALDGILDHATKNILYFDGFELSRSLYLLAKINTACKGLGDQDQKKLGNFYQEWFFRASAFRCFNAQDLSNSIWALGKLNESNPELLHLERANFIPNWLEKASALLWNNANHQNKKYVFKAQNLSNSIWALGKLHESNPKWLHLAKEEERNRVKGFIQDWLEQASVSLRHFNVQNLSNSIWALAKLNESNPDWLHAQPVQNCVKAFIQNWLKNASALLGNEDNHQSKKYTFHAQSLSNSIWALAKLNECNPEWLHVEIKEEGNFIPKWLTKASDLLGTFNAQELSNSISALAKLHESNPKWLHLERKERGNFIPKWLAKASDLLWTFNAQELSNSISALAKLHESNPKWLHLERKERGNHVKEFIQDWLREASDLLRNNSNTQNKKDTFHAQELSNSIWALAKLNESNPELLHLGREEGRNRIKGFIQDWLREASDLLGTFNAQDFSNSIWALAKLHESNPKWLHLERKLERKEEENFISKWLKEASALLGTFNAQDLSNSIWALAKLHESNPKWLHLEREEGENRVKGFIQDWLRKASALLKNNAKNQNKKYAFHAQSLSNSIWALAKLHECNPEWLHVEIKEGENCVKGFIQDWLREASDLLGNKANNQRREYAFNAQDLSNSIWALAKFNECNPKWSHVGIEKIIQPWLREASALLGTFNAQDLSNSIWALAKFNEYNRKWLHVEVEKFIQNWLSKASALLKNNAKNQNKKYAFHAQELSNSIWALAKFNECNPKWLHVEREEEGNRVKGFIQDWLREASALLGNKDNNQRREYTFNAQDLSSSIWALGKLNYNNPDSHFIDVWVKQARNMLVSCNAEFLEENIAALCLNKEAAPLFCRWVNERWSAKPKEELSSKDLVQTIWALAKLNHNDPSFVKDWITVAIGKINAFNVRDLIQSIWALATFNYHDATFMQKWIAQAGSKLSQFETKDCIQILLACGKFNYEVSESKNDNTSYFIKQCIQKVKGTLDYTQHIRILDLKGPKKYNKDNLEDNKDNLDILQEVTQNFFNNTQDKLRTHTFNTRELSQVIWALVKLNHYDSKLIEAWVKEAKDALGEFNAEDLNQSIVALAKLNYYNEPFIQTWKTRVTEKMSQDEHLFTTKNLSNSIWALAKLHVYDETFIKVWCARATQRLENFTAEDLTKSIWAFSKFPKNKGNAQKFIEKWIEQAKSRLQAFDLEEVIQHILALSEGSDSTDATIGVDSMIHKHLAYKAQKEQYFTADSLVQIICSLAKLKYGDSPFIAEWTKTAGPRLSNFDAQGLAKSIWALAKLKYNDEAFIKEWVFYAGNKIAKFNAQDLTQSISALAELKYNDKEFISAWGVYACKKIDGFNAQDLTQSISALASFNFPDSTFMHSWLNQARKKLEEFDACTLVQSINAMDVSKNAQGNRGHLLNIIENWFTVIEDPQKETQGKNFFNEQSLTQLICALAKLKDAYKASDPGQINTFLQKWIIQTGYKISNFNVRHLLESTCALANLGIEQLLESTCALANLGIEEKDEEYKAFKAFIETLCREAEKRLDQFSMQNLSRYMLALARLNHYDAVLVDKWLDMTKIRLPLYHIKDYIQSIWALSIWYDIEQRRDENQNMSNTKMYKIGMAIVNCLKQYSIIHLSQSICEAEVDDFKNSFLGYLFKINWLSLAAKKVANFNPEQLTQSIKALAILNDVGKREAFKAFDAYYVLFIKKWDERAQDSTFTEEEIRACLSALKRLRKVDIKFYKEHKWVY